jgi:hypothetical protein
VNDGVIIETAAGEKHRRANQKPGHDEENWDEEGIADEFQFLLRGLGVSSHVDRRTVIAAPPAD